MNRILHGFWDISGELVGSI